MMKGMQEEYGPRKGKSVYVALENKRRMMSGKKGKKTKGKKGAKC